MMVMTVTGVTGCANIETQLRQQIQEEGLLQTEQLESFAETEADQQSENHTDAATEVQSEFSLASGVQVDNIGQNNTEQTENAAQAASQSEKSQLEEEARAEDESEMETEDTRLTVAIDPGHQGSWVDMSELEPMAPGSSEMKAKASTGTQGTYSGKKEYELNLEISMLLRDVLEERGYRVVLTREDHDTAISNAERALKAWEEGGDIYVRIHANGSDSSSVSGALAMVPSPSNPYVGDLAADSYLLGQCILEEYCQKASFTSQGVQYYDNMSGINWSKIPVMILEMGFMTNQSDDLRMADPSVQSLMAEGIADGIDRYFTEKGLLQQEPSAEEQAAVDSCIEQLGEDYVYPSMEQGERWAVSLTDLDSGASGNLNGDVQMPSASVIKVFLMAAIYDRVCYPSSEDRYIHVDESYDGELRQLINDMITVSDNTAANTLLEMLGGGDAREGMAVVNQFCEEQGYIGTSFGRKFLEENPTGDNYTTANDCCRLLSSIYNGTCVNQEASAKMYAFLKNQTRTWKIPQGIQDTGAQTANKTGELAGEYGCYVENDVAIVESGDQAYVLCVLSDQLRDNGTDQSQIQNISSLVYTKLIS
jgi:N-acetylmuramoyl-L-alanine amidase